MLKNVKKSVNNLKKEKQRFNAGIFIPTLSSFHPTMTNTLIQMDNP